MARKSGFFRDERGHLSSTRLVGISSGLTLCAIGLAQAFSVYEVTVDAALVDALKVTCVGCLLSSQVGKFSPGSNPPQEKVDG